MRKKWFNCIALIAVLVISTVAFSGCGQKTQTLEEMISENPEMATKIEEGLGNIEAEGVSPSISYNKNTIILSMKYDNTFKEDDVKILSEAFEENGESVDAAGEEAVANIKKVTELQNVKIKVQFLNGDGTELWSKTYGGKK